MFAVAPATISAPSPSVTIVRSVVSTVSGPSTVTSGALPKSPETLTDFDASPDGVSMQDAPAVRAPAVGLADGSASGVPLPEQADSARTAAAARVRGMRRFT